MPDTNVEDSPPLDANDPTITRDAFDLISKRRRPQVAATEGTDFIGIFGNRCQYIGHYLEPAAKAEALRYLRV